MQPTVAISLEIELGWGVRHFPGRQGLDRHSEGRVAETAALDRLLTLCDDLQLPITFDIVGHLLLDDCPGRHDSPHSAGWFDNDPGTDRNRDPLYYAPDLIRRIQDAETAHEVCTHTFSHASNQSLSQTAIDWELQTAVDHHTEAGLERPQSFVPPIHAPYPPDRLNAHGITGVRRPVRFRPPVAEPEPPASPLSRIPWRLQRVYPVEVLLRSHPVREPTIQDGLVVHPTTWHASLTAPYLPNGQSDPHGIFKLLPQSVRQRLHKRYLRRGVDRAVSAESYAHFWSHLYNLSNQAQWQPVASFLRTLAARRESGQLTTTTMQALTESAKGAHG